MVALYKIVTIFGRFLSYTYVLSYRGSWTAMQRLNENIRSVWHKRTVKSKMWIYVRTNHCWSPSFRFGCALLFYDSRTIWVRNTSANKTSFCAIVRTHIFIVARFALCIRQRDADEPIFHNWAKSAPYFFVCALCCYNLFAICYFMWIVYAFCI